MPPLRLSDSELEIVFAAARPLAVPDREPFLAAVAEACSLMHERGPGALFRVCRDLQRQWLVPPTLSEIKSVRTYRTSEPRKRAAPA